MIANGARGHLAILVVEMVSNPDLLFKTLKMGELLVKEDLLKVAIWVPVEVKVLTTKKLRFD